MRLKELRKQNKKTQEEIAQILNITQVTYGRYELNQTEPNLETLCKLADYYNVSVDYLIERNFSNEFGYLSDAEKTIITKFRQLSPHNQGIIVGEIHALSLSQN